MTTPETPVTEPECESACVDCNKCRCVCGDDTPEDLAYAKAVQYGRAALGDRQRYEEWLTMADLPADDEAIDEFEKMHATALEELRMDD